MRQLPIVAATLAIVALASPVAAANIERSSPAHSVAVPDSKCGAPAPKTGKWHCVATLKRVRRGGREYTRVSYAFWKIVVERVSPSKAATDAWTH
jgi:hypothetical protein